MKDERWGGAGKRRQRELFHNETSLTSEKGVGGRGG